MLLTIIILLFCFCKIAEYLFQQLKGNTPNKTQKHVCIILVYVLTLLIFQYCMINSNPYKNFNTDKMTILNYIPSSFKPISEYYNQDKSYNYPFILKPTKCTKHTKDVKLIRSKQDLDAYFKDNNCNNTMYQEFIDTPYEVGILYERFPKSKNGKIISVIERTFLKHDQFEVNDKTVSNAVTTKTNFVDHKKCITPQLNHVIDRISKGIPDFYVGRYDIRFNDLNDLKDGKNFFILEANGTMGFDLQKDKHFYFNPISIYCRFRWIFVRLHIGLLNILNGNAVDISVLILCLKNALGCGDWEKIFSVYT